jgi:hypothetical protein
VEALACAGGYTYCFSTRRPPWLSAAELLPQCCGLQASARAAHCHPYFTSLLPKRLLGGRVLAGRRIVSSHHADDTKVYLPDLQEGTVQHLLQRAHRFGQAAGQFVNPLKPSDIPLCGISCPTLGSSVAGVQIVGEATSLGVAVKPVDLSNFNTAPLRAQVCSPGAVALAHHHPPRSIYGG